MKTENLALRKPTWEQNPWPNKEAFKTSNAVDGKYSNRELVEANVRSP